MWNLVRKYKILLSLLGIIFFTLVVGYLIYLFFFKPVIIPPVTTETPDTTTPGILPIAPIGPGQIVGSGGDGQLQVEPGAKPEVVVSDVARGGVTKINTLRQLPSLDPTLNGDGDKLQYYNSQDGKFYTIDKDGNILALSDKIFYNIENIIWSPDKNKAILEYPDGANIVYDFLSGVQATLPKHWKDFDFSPDSGQVVMKSIGLDPDNRWLAVSSADGSKARPIKSLGDKDDTVYPSWSPNKQSIAMYTEGVDFNRQEVFFVGLNNENFKSMIVEGRGFQYQWAPEGDQILYSVYSSNNDMKPSLWIASAQGEAIGLGRKNLNIETWADKCTYSGNTEVYCAVPDSLPEGAGLFPELALTVSDRLYKIDTRTGIKKLIAIPDNNVSISNLMLSENGYYLYFIDDKTGNLNQIKLK